MPVKVPGPAYVSGEIIVGMRDGTSTSDAARVAARYRMHERKSSPRSRARLMRLRSASDMQSVLANIKRRPGVRFAEPNYTRRVLLAAPDDPAYNNLDSTVAVWEAGNAIWYQWGMHIIDALGAWNIYPNTYYTAATKPTNPTKVAVIDTGLDIGGTDSTPHPDFINLGGSSPDALLGGQVDMANGINMMGGYSPTDFADDYGHGTSVSGVIGAATNNGGSSPASGMAGLGYHCQIMPIKSFDNTGYGTEWDMTQSIYWAVDHGALIINISAGDVYYSQLEQDAVHYAWEHGSLVLAAAGNEGDSMNRPSYPAACTGVMGVGSTSWPLDAPASYSNFGDYVDVAAPGGDADLETLSFWLTWSTMPTEPVPMHYAGMPEGTPPFQYQTGTSLACPFVAGLASLYAASEGITQSTPGGVLQIFQAIQRGCDGAGGVPGWHPYWGWGRINAEQTLLNNDNRASTLGAITGQVTYYDTAVQNAVVTATPTAGGSVPGATTRSDGMYRIANIDPGTYDVAATYFGQTKTIEDVVALTSCDTPRVLLNIDNPLVGGSTPNSAPNSGTVDITNLAGLGFQDGATVKLTKAGQPDIDATSVVVASFTQITCSADLTGVAPGAWDITVTNPDGQWGTLTEGFTVDSDDATPPEISSWSVAADHGGLGEIACAAPDEFIECRNSGLAKLVITFSEALDPATVSAASLSIQGVNSGDVSSQISVVSLQDVDSAMAVTLSPALPDQDTYTLTVATTVQDPAGNPLAGDRDHVLTALKGDANSTRSVNTLDLMAVRAHVNESVTDANARYDVNNSGTINTLDMMAARAYSGNSAPAPPVGGGELLAGDVGTYPVDAGWHLLSFAAPGAPMDAPMGLGRPATDWNAYGMIAGSPTPYVPVDPGYFRRGRGYWIHAFRGGALGAGVAPMDADSTFAADLPTGWSIIGCPFMRGVPWNDAYIQVERAGTVLPLQEAAAKGWLYGTIYGYTNGSYVPLEPGSSPGLEPWGGYLICAQSACKLLVNLTPNVTTGASSDPVRKPSADAWRINLVAAANGFADACTVIGRQNGTQTPTQPHPPLGPGVDLFVQSTGVVDGSPGNAIDLRSGGRSATWDIGVRSAQGDAPVTVTWPDLSELPTDLAAYLVDPVGGKRIYMRTATSHTFRGPQRALRVEVKPHAATATITSLSAVPTGAGRADITFTLSADAQVEATLMNIAGRPVKVLASGDVCTAGVNVLHWDGRSATGTRAPAGRYLLSLLVKQPDGRQSQRVVPVNVRR